MIYVDPGELWQELERIQKQRDEDMLGLQNTINQLFESNQTKIKESEYKRVLNDIKRLGKSLEEIENVIIKEACNKSGSIYSIADFKKSVLSNRAENEHELDHNEPLGLPDLEKENMPEVERTQQKDIHKVYEEMEKNKEEIIDVIEGIRTEIYDNLDDILQSHVNALEEKKLLGTFMLMSTIPGFS